MKYFLAFLGVLIGQLIGAFIAGSRVLNWILGFILGGVGFLLPAFFRYARSTPQQILTFHGPDAPISRSTSSGELRTFLSQLHKGGLLLSFTPHGSDAKVDEAQWRKLQDSEKLTFFQVLAQAQKVDASPGAEIRIFAQNGIPLAKYSIRQRTIQSHDGNS
jgi:hypothetical protein